MTATTTDMTVMDAIYGRRATRDYTPRKIERGVIATLLKSAVYAPTAMHSEPWAFAVLQDRDMFTGLTKRCGEQLKLEAHTLPPEQAGRLIGYFDDPNFNVCYNASTMIVIYGKPAGPFVAADCWLAAENLMLAACSMGLGTCVIGLAISALNTPAWKAKLGIPDEMTAYVSIIVGEPAGAPPLVPRKEPEILVWKT
jgi:nitroreductase